MIVRNLTNIDITYQTVIGISVGIITNRLSHYLIKLLHKDGLIILENDYYAEIEQSLWKKRTDDFIFINCIAPVIEEMFFRGIIQPVIQISLQQFNIPSYLANTISLLSTNMIFAAGHPGQTGKIASLISGLAYSSLSLVYEGNILPSVIAHMTHNLISSCNVIINGQKNDNPNSSQKTEKLLKKNVDYQLNKNTLFQSRKNNMAKNKLNNFYGIKLDVTDEEMAKSVFARTFKKG